MRGNSSLSCLVSIFIMVEWDSNRIKIHSRRVASLHHNTNRMGFMSLIMLEKDISTLQIHSVRHLPSSARASLARKQWVERTQSEILERARVPTMTIGAQAETT